MYSKINSMCVRGIDGLSVSVEVDVTNGLPEYSLVGFVSSEVREARERVKTAIRNSGFDIPPKRITINLAPANIKKEGTAFDLAIAIGILESLELFKSKEIERVVILGELGLDGKVCPVSGVLPMTIAAKEAGYEYILVPSGNASEASIVSGIKVVPVETLGETVRLLTNSFQNVTLPSYNSNSYETYDVDFREVNGQPTMRRAAEVAAAGMHNILFIGSPGSGKTMIARRIPTILPELTGDEQLEVTKIYSVMGLTSAANPIKRVRPFRSPHHTISAPALIGGGKNPHPGEISLADRGVLFLDELPEFQKNVLESLRQPLEDKEVSVVRMERSETFPANFMLCAAMNPCRCGYYPDRNKCSCNQMDVKRYMQRISRPLLDRIDICVEAPPLIYKDLKGENKNESSADIRQRVEEAWSVQRMRFKDSDVIFNSQMRNDDIKKYCVLNSEDEKMMEDAFEKMNLSARAYHRILRVARTIADLDGCVNIEREHIFEALGYRSISDKIWT